MRVGSMVLLPIVALATSPCAVIGQDGDDRPGIAVLPFDVTQLPPTNLGESGLNFGLQQMLVTDLQANSALRMVDRRALNDVMRELELHGSGNVDEQTAAQIGRIVGARYMIGTSYFDNDGDVRLDARVIDVETTEVISTARATDSRDDLFELIGTLADDVTQEIDLPALLDVVRDARQAQSVPMEAIELLSFAVASDEMDELDQAIQYLDLALERWPEYADAAELRLRLLNGSGV